MNLILVSAQGVFGPAVVAGRGPFGPAAGPSKFGPLSGAEPRSPAEDGLTPRQRTRYQAQLYPLEVYRNVSQASAGLLLEVGSGELAEALRILDLAANNSKVSVIKCSRNVPTFFF